MLKTQQNFKILILTGIFPPDIGGAAGYAKNLKEEFLSRGYEVRTIFYKIEKKLPVIVRHFFYFFRVIFNIRRADLMIALDTLSVGLPSLTATLIFRKKIIVRVSGDFFWESYIEKSGELITLEQFYKDVPLFSVKEKLIFFLTKLVLNNSSAVVFTTDWQMNIFKKPYNLEKTEQKNKIYVIENFYGNKIQDSGFQEKNFLWAGRSLKLKNLEILKSAFNEAQKEYNLIKLEISEKTFHNELIKKIQNCYAVIQPSLSDVSPNFILEAIRANKPFILTKETGLFERLRNIGLFIDPLNRGDLKNKILFLANDKNYFEYKEKIASFNFFHSWAEIANEFLTIYKNL